jgi:hypothetical protein
VIHPKCPNDWQLTDIYGHRHFMPYRPVLNEIIVVLVSPSKKLLFTALVERTTPSHFWLRRHVTIRKVADAISGEITN